MTTYCSMQDLDSLLDGFTARYYGTYLDEGDTLTIGTQFSADQEFSYEETNEWLAGVTSMGALPVATMPTSGNYPLSVRHLQANLMIYRRLKGRHFGEFTNQVPGWVNVYLNNAQSILSDIREQKVVFETDTTQAESGISQGSFSAKAGAAYWYSNWETGVYRHGDFPRTYIISIDGTTPNNNVGTATFKASFDNGISWATTAALTATSWTNIDGGLMVRWEANPNAGTIPQLSLGDTFVVHCVPMNINVKGAGIRYVTFKRG